MGGGNKRKKKKCYLPLWWIGTLQKKYRNKYKENNASPLISKKRRKKSKSQDDVIMFQSELKDMRKLSANDEAFFLSTETVKHVIDIIHSRKTPTHEMYKHWNEPVISFYLKMCTCFGVDYQHLEAATYEDDDKEQETRIECAQPSTNEMSKSNEECSRQQTHIECAQPSTTEMSYEELLEQEENTPICSFGLCYHNGPFKFGSYSPETTPDRIPYHMYLLVKEAADIMNTTKCQIALETVEQKIFFFRTYLYCHLPAGWKYDWDNPSSLIAGYDTTRTPRYCMDNFTPIGNRVEILGIDPDVWLSSAEMAGVMSIIHSRKTPSFWKMRPEEISFYCKLCSCFGIDYHRLEDASEEDVCLMRVT